MTVAFATRIHLGSAKEPPVDLKEKIELFSRFCHGDQFISSTTEKQSRDSVSSVIGVIAVDAEERIPGYDLVEAVRTISSELGIHVVPVQPWGKFAPALNALVQFACSHPHVSQILFVSAETTAPRNSTMLTLQSHMKDDTLVVGAVLPGHDYSTNRQGGKTEIKALDGRTAPWNTLALWNLSKLALTGFQLCSEGLIDVSKAGVEEVAAIALLQSLFPETCKAKLVPVQGVTWDQDFTDLGRLQWHERKMQSKIERPAFQLGVLGLHKGTVEHITATTDQVHFFVTGFGPFDTIQENPTELICRKLKSHMLSVTNKKVDLDQLDTVVIETSAKAASDAVAGIYSQAKRGCRTVVLHLGLNYRGTTFELEQFAYNDASFRVPDQRGFQPQREVIIDGRSIDDTLETKLDVRLLAETMTLQFNDVETIVSQDPGRFVCNYTYYQSLAMAHDLANTSCIFLHIPNLTHLQVEDYIVYVEKLMEVCTHFSWSRS